MRVLTGETITRICVGSCLAAAGCILPAEVTEGEPRVCTAELRPAFAVTVQDDSTGAFIASGATLIVQDGAFADTAAFPAGQPEFNSRALTPSRTFERPGTYTIRVTRPPYITHVAVGIPVTSDGCHVQTQALSLRLRQSLSAP